MDREAQENRRLEKLRGSLTDAFANQCRILNECGRIIGIAWKSVNERIDKLKFFTERIGKLKKKTGKEV